MISGAVNSAREAVISVEVKGTSEPCIIEAVIDTGFTDYFTLPAAIVKLLGLQIDSVTRVTLADEFSSVANVYLAEINWAKQLRTIQVLGMAGVPLVGMAMLEGSHLHIHAVEGGAVTIE